MTIYANTKALSVHNNAERLPRLYLNGKFYSTGMNGVNRSADRLLRALDECATAGGEAIGWDMRLLLPRGAMNVPHFENIRQVHSRMRSSQFWEQAVLPFLAADGLLLSLANFAPILHGRKVTMVHDAQFRISPESYSPRRRLGYRAVIPAGAQTSLKVLTVSHYARASLEMFGIAKRQRIAVVANGGEHILERDADKSILRRLGLGAKPFVMMFGSSADYKNVKILFDAFNFRKLAGFELVIVGSNHKALVKAGLPVPRRAIFAGPVDDPELRALYEASLCLLFPSRTEGFGLPPLEAMFCGCPVVAAPAGAMPEVCQDAILYAGVDDAEEWIGQIQRLAASQELRHEKSADGLKRAETYRWIASGRALVASIAPLMGTQAHATSSRPSRALALVAADPPKPVSMPQVA